jgi:ABC-type nickel/cobalt efflux system permease component RcnA
MSNDLNVLLALSASVGFLHTLSGPDHYLPFIVMAKARNWNTFKTIWITFLCGVGHVGSSIVIGTIGIAFGIGIQKLQIFEAFRGNLAAWAFVTFGFLYFLWGIWKVRRKKRHQHFHFHDDGTVHVHQHQHFHAKNHQHQHATKPDKPVNLTPWILFTVFVLGPCEPLIPILMYPAATANIGGIVMVSSLFSFCTIATMITIVVLSLYGINFLPMKVFEKYMHPLAGATICLSGLAIVFLGL